MKTLTAPLVNTGTADITFAMIVAPTVMSVPRTSSARLAQTRARRS